MLASDPLPGTRVLFLRPYRTAQAGDIGTLLRSMRIRGRVELPNDAFIVQFGSDVFMVERRDLEVAYPTSGVE